MTRRRECGERGAKDATDVLPRGSVEVTKVAAPPLNAPFFLSMYGKDISTGRADWKSNGARQPFLANFVSRTPKRQKIRPPKRPHHSPEPRTHNARLMLLGPSLLEPRLPL
jgi:hypothetical protein